LSYIAVAESLAIFSTTSMQFAPKATEFAEIMQNNGSYAVHGHSRSLIFIPIENPYATA